MARALFLNRPLDDLLVRSSLALGLTQRDFGRALGSSHRTAQRWFSRRAKPTVDQVKQLAVLVHPHDAQLASELAAAASETLESLGLVKRAAPAPPPPPAPAPPPRPPLDLLVGAVVLAAADAAEVSTASARAALGAALRRMRELEVTAEELAGALEGKAKKKG